MQKKIKILVTTTSFQDSKGDHLNVIKNQPWEVDYLRGPLIENDLINIISDYDGVLCGDDEYTDNVIKKGASGKLKVISKYGVGLDKIDLKSAKSNNIIVRNCPGINQFSVAEHVLALIMTYEKNIHIQFNTVKKGSWKRLVGRDIRGKNLGIIGLGSIGKELARLANNFGLNVFVYDISIDKKFLSLNNDIIYSDLNYILKESDYVSIHIPLNNKTKKFINKEKIKLMKRDSILINTARGEIINKFDLINSLKNNQIRGYLCDVLDNEPIKSSEELLGFENVIISPHVASRTFENIEKQGLKSLNNLIEEINKRI